MHRNRLGKQSAPSSRESEGKPRVTDIVRCEGSVDCEESEEAVARARYDWLQASKIK